MKVPEGKTVYYGGKKIKAGGEVPDKIAKGLATKPAAKPPAKPPADKPTVKP